MYLIQYVRKQVGIREADKEYLVKNQQTAKLYVVLF